MTPTEIKRVAHRLTPGRIPMASRAVALQCLETEEVIAEWELPTSDEERDAVAVAVLEAAAEVGPCRLYGTTEVGGDLLGNGHVIEPPTAAEAPTSHDARARDGLAPALHPGRVAVPGTTDGLIGAGVVLGLVQAVSDESERSHQRRERFDRQMMDLMAQALDRNEDLAAKVLEAEIRAIKAESAVEAGTLKVWEQIAASVAPKAPELIKGVVEVAQTVVGGIGQSVVAVLSRRLP